MSRISGSPEPTALQSPLPPDALSRCNYECVRCGARWCSFKSFGARWEHSNTQVGYESKKMPLFLKGIFKATSQKWLQSGFFLEAPLKSKSKLLRHNCLKLKAAFLFEAPLKQLSPKWLQSVFLWCPFQATSPKWLQSGFRRSGFRAMFCHI